MTDPQPGINWRYRVGGYRVICDIQDDTLCILVTEAGNRDIYRQAEQGAGGTSTPQEKDTAFDAASDQAQPMIVRAGGAHSTP